MIPEEKLKLYLGLYVPTLVLILVPAVLIVFLIRTQRGEIRNVTGSNLETAARTAALRIDQYLVHLVDDVEAIATGAYLVAETTTHSALEYSRARVEEVDSAWKADGAPPEDLLNINPLETGLAEYLQSVVRDHAAYHELIVADSRGRLIAASGVTSDYDQLGEQWFDSATKDCRRGPISCTTVLDISFDESTAASGFEISTPIVNSGGATVGVLKAVVDPLEIVSFLDAVESTGFAEAFLLHEDGNVILSGTQRGIVGEQSFFAADSVRAWVDRARPHDPEFQFLTQHPDGTQRLVGASRDRIRHGSLPWIVAVVEPDTLIQGFVGAQIWYVVAIAGLFAFLLSNLVVRRTRNRLESATLRRNSNRTEDTA